MEQSGEFVEFTHSWESGDVRKSISKKPTFIRRDGVNAIGPSLNGGSVVFFVNGTSICVDEAPKDVMRKLSEG